MPHAVEATLAFTRPDDVEPGRDRGVLRARSLDPDALHGPEAFAHHRCQILDCAAPAAEQPRLIEHGFEAVDLTGREGLPELLEHVRVAGQVTDDEAHAIRRALAGASLPLAGGQRLRLLHMASEGFIMRRGGPGGLRLTASATAPGMNDHDAAVSVHADQDVHGTPVRQILRGAGPWLFRHAAPTSTNRRSRLVLLNLWVPLQQVTRPLALMDGRSLDRPAHQLRHALVTDAFLERPPDRRVNDIWTFLHHPDQRWFFRSDASPATAWVFDTLSTPHGAFEIPGERHAAELYRRLSAALHEGAAPAPPPEPGETPATPELAAAIEAMTGCLRDAPTAPDGWAAAAEAALDRVVRKSIEMRVVAWLVGRPTS